MAVVRRAAPKMVVVWRGSLEESWVLRISLEVAMVWRASPEMVVVRCTALEEAVVQQTSPRRLWFARVTRVGLGLANGAGDGCGLARVARNGSMP